MIEEKLRLAKLDDIPILMRFAKNFYKSSPYRSMRFDNQKGEKFLRDVITGSLADAVVLVSLEDGVPSGFLVGAANQPVFSSAKIATELGWWVEPEHRKRKSAFLMFQAYEDWAYRIGCSHIQAAFLPGVSPDLDKFYKKRDYVQVESSYLKVLRIG